MDECSCMDSSMTQIASEFIPKCCSTILKLIINKTAMLSYIIISVSIESIDSQIEKMRQENGFDLLNLKY